MRLALLVAASATALTMSFGGHALADPITKNLSVRVYQICDDAGNNCASTGPAADPFYAAATNKIYAQAGISVSFTLISQVSSSRFLTIDDAPGSNNSFVALQQFVDPANFMSSTVEDLFLVHVVSDSSDESDSYGEANPGVGGAVMAMDTILSYMSSSGLGRLDTFAHEFGHTLGLEPASLGGDAGAHVPDNGINNQLMAAGGYRNVPATLGDIAPDGLGYDLLTPAEGSFARQSSLLTDVSPVGVPEPSSLLVVSAGLGVVGMVRRRRVRPSIFAE